MFFSEESLYHLKEVYVINGIIERKSTKELNAWVDNRVLRTKESGNRIMYLKTDNQQSIWVLYKKQSDGKICIYFAVTLPSLVAVTPISLIVN